MSLESALHDELIVICPRVFPDFAPAGTVMPYITWHQFGGESPTYLDGTLPDKRCAYIQINVWASTRATASDMSLQIEEALCNSTALIVWPQAAMQSAFSEDQNSRGSMQDFEIWYSR